MIYFIQEETCGSVKIGYSINPGRRLSELQVGIPRKLNLISVVEGDKSNEKDLHEYFKEYLVRGEWYKPTTEILLYIRKSLQIINCPICGMSYVPNSPEDVTFHNERHDMILRGALPYRVRELMKKHAWELAKEDDRSFSEDAKLSIAYSWWARARGFGLPDDVLDDFIICHLELINAQVDSNTAEINRINNYIKSKWGEYL